MKKIFERKYILIVVAFGLLVWLQTINFWFFKGYEATWLTGLAPYNLVNLLRGHAILYFLDYKIFGWNPMGWYITSLLFHLLSSILLFYFINLLTKNRLLAFLSSLFFVASTSYNDVLTWGSFNSYYPFLLSTILLALIFFLKFSKSGKWYFFFLSSFFSFISFFIRETGIMVVILIFLYELFVNDNLRKKKIFIIVRNLLPFLAILMIFFGLRFLYGGTIGDSADSNVKLQMRYVKDGLYFEYFKAAVLTFGKLVPPQIIPYPFLNFAREALRHIFTPRIIDVYFFPLLGWSILSILGLIAVKFRKNNLFRFFIFFFLWQGAFSAFVSLAVPNTREVLIRDYEWNTMRYRYFAFLGTSFMLSSISILFYRHYKKLITLSLLIFFLINLFLIFKIENYIYVSAYKPQKEFYTSFRKDFPNLPKGATFYLYPNAPGLSDYLLEWYLTKESNYPNLIGQPFRVESQIIAVINKLRTKKINLSDVFFLDYAQGKGLIDKTSEVRKIILTRKIYPLKFYKNENFLVSNINKGPSVEFPYDLKMNISLSQKADYTGKTPDSGKFKILTDYLKDRENFLNTAKIETAYTASQRAGEPFFHTLPSFLIDGNTGPRSKWIADTFNPWVIADLGKVRSIAGVSWGSLPGSTRVPATYSIFSSIDGKSWNKIFSVKNSTKTESLDKFNNPVEARYIKMEIYTTSGGDFVLLDEFEVIGEKVKAVFDLYNERDSLLRDANNLFNFISGKEDLEYLQKVGLTKGWAKITWETDKTKSSENFQYWYFPVSLKDGSQELTVPLIEGEIYAGEGQFLKKHITSISLDFQNLPYIIEINSSVLSPRERLK